MKSLIPAIFCFLISILLLLACKKEKPNPQVIVETGKIKLSFAFFNQGQPQIFDELNYTNSAGNQYLVNEIQFFVSEVNLYSHDGKVVNIDDWEIDHYVDTDIPDTHTWEVFDPIPAGLYDSIAFRFGISEARNQSFMFVNPPESYMFWPEFLGGGYHCMKLNGKWVDTSSTLLPFDFHLGTGQIYSGNTTDVDSITGFVHNDFRVSLPLSAFSIGKDQTVHITLRMNVEKWFCEPHVYDHNIWRGDIMQKQAAMQIVKENGWNVFTISSIE
ncbi:MAG: hypothetical protein KKA07_18285 [Bacteroidetes bacterium]|nr:hypothetical protein [Bacteroidota bacterium]MBU1721020.1 hypothetical protein [Bacteroidota bacterium]